MVFYNLYGSVDELITAIRTGKESLPLNVVDTFADIPMAEPRLGGKLVPALESTSYWSRNIPTVVFLMGETGYILLTK